MVHWAEVLAEDLLRDERQHVLATGITPSGPIHIGNMREVLTTDAVYRSLKEKGATADFIYIADDFDHLRKVYPYLPSSYEQYVGIPICDIPCPCGDHESYADHYLSSFLQCLQEVGIAPEVHRASTMYRTGEYAEAIQTALEHTETIRHIIETISKRQLPKNWIPFNIRCDNCKRLTTAKPILYEFPMIEYTCSCGYEGTVDVRKPGVGKLPWRIDWPARWKMLKVTFEPFGKDLGTVGGARETGEHIVRDVYEYPPPKYTMYEFIMLKGKGAMHSSKGTALSAEELLKMTPPEVLRFLMMKQQPTKHIMFDPGFGLLSLVDEFDQFENVYFGVEEKIRGMKDLTATYELSQPYSIPKRLPVHIPYRHLVTLVQIGETWDAIKSILLRTQQLTEDLSSEDEQRLRQRVDHALYWLSNFAPESLRFTVQQKLPKLRLDKGQQMFLSILIGVLPAISWDPEAIHNAIYDATEEVNISIKTSFKTIYQLFLAKDKGPRVGYFLSMLDKGFVLDRCKEALK